MLITAGEDAIVRNILETGVWEYIAKARGSSLLCLIVPEGREAELSARFSGEGVSVRSWRRSSPTKARALVETLLYAAVATHTNHWSKMRAYLRGSSSLVGAYAKRLHSYLLGWCHPYQRLLRSVYRRAGRDQSAEALFNEVQPELVIALSITNFEIDVPVLREAKRRGIRTVGMTRSWDNLTSHGAVRVPPERLIVQNDFLKEAARSVQGIRPRDAAIDVVGLPHYGVALSVRAYAGSREEFCREHGLDPAKKIILYGAMGTLLFLRENDVPQIFGKLIAANAFGEPAQIWYRQHPKFPIAEGVAGAEGVYIDRGASMRKGSGERGASEELFRQLYHADVVVTAASTFAIDAALLDKPVVCIAFDGSAKTGELSYWASVKRFYDRYTHFEELLAQGGVRIAYTPDALAAEVKRYFAHPELEQAGRARIVSRLVGPHDGRATERLGSIFAEEIAKLSP